MTNQTEYKWVAMMARTLVGVGSLVAAVVIFKILAMTKPQLEVSDAKPPPTPVQVIRAATAQVQRQWRGFGSADAMDSADVPARVVTAVYKIVAGIEPGVAVNKDQPLLLLDPTDFNRQVEIAQNNLREIDALLTQLEVERKSTEQLIKLANEDVQLANVEMQRVRKVFERAAGSSKDLDRAKREVIIASRNNVSQLQVLQMIDHRKAQLKARQTVQQSKLQQAREDVVRCRIVSPLDGVVESLDVEMGEHVTSGQRVARVVSLRRIEVALRLPAAARSDAKPGNAVTLTSTNNTNKQWKTVIARVSPVDDANTRTVTVYVELIQDQTSPNPLSPGQFLEAVITGGDLKQRWVVPERALRGDRLSLVSGQRVVTRPVEVDFLIEKRFEQFGLDDDQWAALSTALSPGELIIVNPSQSTSEGRLVRPIIGGERTAERTEPEQSG